MGTFVFVENRLDKALAQAALKDPDRRLVQELVFGILRHRSTLDWLIRRKTEDREQKPVLLNLLRLGLYQMFFLDRIPDHACVNETVEIAHTLGHGAQAGFINAILRAYSREQEATRQLLVELKTSDPATGHAHPQWLYERWLQRYGPDQTRQLMEWDNTPAKVFARVNTLRATPTKLLARWREAENVAYDFRRFDWVPENLVFELKSPPPMAALASFQEGWFYIQDPSTILAVKALDPQPGERILDVCAAPGGKTTLIAQFMQNTGKVMAQDSDPARLVRVRENLDRLGITCANTSTINNPAALDAGMMYDRVLVDTPCSNTGVVRRRVELRWRLQPSEITRLHGEQFKILTQAAARVKPEGVLVYSTCSLEPEENQQVVQRFLAANPSWCQLFERQLTPFKDQVDGAYVAKLYRE